MNKSILFLASVFFLTLASANIIITNNPISIDTQVNHEQNVSITIKNNFTFDIFDFSFSELGAKGFTFPNITLEKNTSATYQVLVKTNQSYHGTINSLVAFKFYVNLPEGTTTHNIGISDYGLNSTYNTIRDGDTVSWFNRDDITHRIYSTQFGTISIAPNSSSSYTFTALGSFNYYDLDFNIFNEFHGTIEVVNKTSQQKAHNPNYDETWVVNLNSVLDPTLITAENSQSSFDIEYGKYKKGLITITNSGTIKAEGINLSSDSDWITFDENNFDLSPGATEWVEYTIFPNMMTTDGTNKTYNKTILIKGFNSNQTNISVGIYIPYKEISGDLTSDVAVLEYLEKYFCPANPCSLLCGGLNNAGCNSSISSGSSSNQTITANMTTQDLYNTLKILSKMQDQLDRSENDRKEFEEKYGSTFEEMYMQINKSVSMSEETKKDKDTQYNLMWIIGVTLVIGGSIISMIIYFNKKSDKDVLVSMFSKWKGEE